MKHQHFQFAPNEKDGVANTNTTVSATAPVIDITALLDKNKLASSAAASQTIDVMVTGINGWKPTTNGLPRVMVITDKGNFWPLESAVKNMPKSFFQPVKARATVTPRKVGEEMRLNMSQLEFEGLDTTTALAIAEMKPGTALFANIK
jgi:hypothetical protein